jgi:hypothetical protein
MGRKKGVLQFVHLADGKAREIVSQLQVFIHWSGLL